MRGAICALPIALFSWQTARAADFDADDTGDVAAIQNRTYHMGQELEAAISVLPYDAFYKGIAGEVAYTFHFTDGFAWEAVRFGYATDFDTNLKTQLLNLGVAPTTFEEVQLFVSSDVVWTPFYLKAAAFNHYVLYGELYGLLGGGAFETTQAWRPAPNIGLGGRLFLNRYWSLRLEVSGVENSSLIESSLPSIVDINLGLSLNFGFADGVTVLAALFFVGMGSRGAAPAAPPPAAAAHPATPRSRRSPPVPAKSQEHPIPPPPPDTFDKALAAHYKGDAEEGARGFYWVLATSLQTAENYPWAQYFLALDLEKLGFTQAAIAYLVTVAKDRGGAGRSCRWP